jgi:hypothetical protein
MERLAQLLQLLFACYLNTKVGKENFAAYTLVLKDVPVNELEVVIKQIMSNPGAFPPSPGDILEMYRRLQHHTNPQVAQQGWESVRRAILGVGSRGTPRFRDPIVQDRAVRQRETRCGQGALHQVLRGVCQWRGQ